MGEVEGKKKRMIEAIILLDMGFYSVWGLWNVSRMRERERIQEKGKKKGLGEEERKITLLVTLQSLRKVQ